MSSRKIFIFIALMFLLTTFLASTITATFPRDKPTIYVDPPRILDLPPSSTFTISVKIFNVTNLYGYDLKFRWNPEYLAYVSHTVLAAWKLPLKDEVYPEGWYWIAYSRMAPDKPVSGNITIFTMTFRVVGVGSCYLDFISTDLADSSVPAKPIPHYVQGGYFSNAPPPPPAKVGIAPRKIVDATLTPCNNFAVNVTIEKATNLFEYEFKLGYDTAILDCVEITEGPFLKNVGPTSIKIYDINEAKGILHFGVKLLVPKSATGNGVLATITFHVTGTGETILDLHDLTLKNLEGEALPFDPPVDGYFNNMMITKLFVHPPELIDPTMKPGDKFQINVKIENVVDMYGYGFTLGYDTKVLTCLGAMVIPPTIDTNFNVQLFINDAAGVLLVNVQHYPPAEPITIYGSETLVVVWFMVQSYGQTLLDLYNTKVSDPLGNPISHEVGDGFFATLLRDVAIIDVKVTSPNKVYPGRIVTIEVVAMNRGNMTTETFNVTVYYNDNPIETRSITLRPWSNASLTFYWNTSGLTPCSNYTISARASHVPYEVNLDNNIFVDGWVKIKMLGDITGDGIIDIYDVTTAAAIYGSQIGDPKYLEDADLAPPWGIINIYDVVTICAFYGRTC